MKPLVQYQFEANYLFRINILFLILFLVGTLQVFAQEIQITSSSEKESSIYDQMQGQSDSLLDGPNQLGNIPIEELEAFDPSTIPESVPVSDADWIFEVPVNVKNIPSEIQKIGLIAVVFKFMKDGKRVDFGKGQVRIKLTNGAYDGNVTVGVNYSEELVKKAKDKYYDDFLPSEAKEYEVWMYLIGPDNRWEKPSLKQASPPWRMADSSQPFRWKTGRQNLSTTSNNSFDEGAVGTVGNRTDTDTTATDPINMNDLWNNYAPSSGSKKQINPGSVDNSNNPDSTKTF